MPNRHLGHYDMVLALSESKINAELKSLFKRGTIRRQWQFMTHDNSGETANYASPDFERNMKDWLNGSPTLQGKYNMLVNAEIDAPQIRLLRHRYDEVLFLLTVAKGTLHHLSGRLILQQKLDKIIYAFRVPIAKVRIQTDKMYFAGADAMAAIRQEGLNDHDFTVDAILLNFERADVANFSLADSSFPTGTEYNGIISRAFSGYFKSLGKDRENPYVLGYALKKKSLSSREKAMLYPTATSYSTTFSKQERASAVNFLMVTGDRAFPEGPEAGRIMQSLIEEVQDKTPTVNGAIAIDLEAFNRTYVESLSNAVAENFEKAFRRVPALQEYQIHRRTEKNAFTSFTFTKQDFRMTFEIHPRSIVNTKEGIIIPYAIIINGNVHAEIERKVLHVIKAGTVGVDQAFSTSGRFPLVGQTGREGSLLINVKPSNEGKLSLFAQYNAPMIGANTEKPQTNSGWDDVWLVVSNLLTPLGPLGMAINFLTDDANKSILKFDDQLFERLELETFGDFSSRVILPGSNVYTFKNIRLNQAEPYLQFDIAYAVATD